jgi:hypothetical protein
VIKSSILFFVVQRYGNNRLTLGNADNLRTSSSLFTSRFRVADGEGGPSLTSFESADAASTIRVEMEDDKQGSEAELAGPALLSQAMSLI